MYLVVSQFLHSCECTVVFHVGQRATALAALGISSVEAGRAELKRYGRRGRMPWCHPKYKEHLSYISPADIVVVPVAHCLLRGLVRSLFMYALDTPVSTVRPTHSVVFNTSQRDKVKVRFRITCAPAVHLGLKRPSCVSIMPMFSDKHILTALTFGISAGIGRSHCVSFRLQSALPLCCQIHQIICDGGARQLDFHRLLHRAVRPCGIQELMDASAACLVALSVWL